MNRALRRILACLVPAVLAAGSASAAESRDPARSDLARPHLGGHSFVENPIVPGPFVRSYVYNRIGIGQARNLELQPVEIGGEQIPGLRGELMYALLDFETQYAIKPWVGIRARVSVAGRLGTDVQALLAEGVNLVTGFEFGWLIQLREGRRTAWSLDFGLLNRDFTGVNITRFVEDVIEGTTPVLVNKSPSVRGFGGARFAWAAGSLVGINLRAVGGYAESIDRLTADDLFLVAGASVDFDVKGRTALPLGAALGYSYDTLPEASQDPGEGASTWFARLSYVGRQDFLLSLDYAYQYLPEVASRKAIGWQALSLSLQYFF